jgi:hypothetical protein
MSKRLAIMQPYFFPYIGYFQLINSVDEFVVYDNIQYTKKGWINRNRILCNGSDKLITLPLKHDHDILNVVDRVLSATWIDEKYKLLNLIRACYNKAPFFESTYEVVERCICNNKTNLFEFLLDCINQVNDFLGIRTEITISSKLNIDQSLKSKDKVLVICKERGAGVYINTMGGHSLYDRHEFKINGIDLFFIRPDNIQYTQFNSNFVPWLSIIDVMMFNPRETINNYLSSYSLI